MELPKRLQYSLTNVVNMGHIQTFASVLSTEELTTYLKQDREKWRAMFHTCIKLFFPAPVYVYIYYISGRKWSTIHIAQISQEQDRYNIYAIMKTMWPPCYRINGFVATHALGHDEQSCNGTSSAEGMICHIFIVVAGRARCFHDCINLVTRAILKNSSLSSYSKKMRWGRVLDPKFK